MNKIKTQKLKEQTEQINSQVHEQIRPLFEDFGNVHIHDEKSYNDLKDKN